MYILFIIIVFIFFTDFNIIHEPFKPKPTLISNKKQTNNQIPIFVNPNDVPNEYTTREDVLENQNVSVQPKDMYYDIFDTNCVFSYNKPLECVSAVRGSREQPALLPRHFRRQRECGMRE